MSMSIFGLDKLVKAATNLLITLDKMLQLNFKKMKEEEAKNKKYKH